MLQHTHKSNSLVARTATVSCGKGWHRRRHKDKNSKEEEEEEEAVRRKRKGWNGSALPAMCWTGTSRGASRLPFSMWERPCPTFCACFWLTGGRLSCSGCSRSSFFGGGVAFLMLKVFCHLYIYIYIFTIILFYYCCLLCCTAVRECTAAAAAAAFLLCILSEHHGADNEWK